MKETGTAHPRGRVILDEDVSHSMPFLSPDSDLLSDPRPSPLSPDGSMPTHIQDALRFSSEIHKETDRGSVLVCASYIDEMLERTIKAFTVESMHKDIVESSFSPIGSFGARIIISYSLNLITKEEYDDIKLIKKIRNIFAHEMYVSFSDDRIKSHCASLVTFDGFFTDKKNYKDRFITSCIFIGNQLTPRPKYAADLRVHLQDRIALVDIFNKKLRGKPFSKSA